jgi:hypothetical protein
MIIASAPLKTFTIGGPVGVGLKNPGFKLTKKLTSKVVLGAS